MVYCFVLDKWALKGQVREMEIKRCYTRVLLLIHLLLNDHQIN